MNYYRHSINVDTLLLNDEYNLLIKAVHPLNGYHNPLHDVGVSTNEKDLLPNTLWYSMNVADHSPNHCDYLLDY